MFNFSDKYNKKNFINFLKDNFPFEEISQNIQITNPKLFKTITKIGEIKFNDVIPVLEVEHSSKNDPRIELTRSIHSIISGFSIENALVIFFCSDSEKYRLSLIESSLIWENNVNVKRQFSNPKRLSYLLGIDAKIHTPHNQLRKKIKNYKDLKSAFDKEVVTEEFFENYKRLFLDFNSYLEKIKNLKNSRNQ